MEPGGRVLVTGASRGIGRSLAIEFARRGFDVVAGVRDVSASAADLKGAVKGLLGTLTVEHLDMVNLETYTLPADLRILINNAGFRGRYLPVEVASLEEWRKTFETNFFGLIMLTQRAIPILRARGGGVICNIGSTSIYTPAPFYSVYRSSKVALGAVSECLRAEVAPFGIRVIEIPIGGVDTDMMRSGIAHNPPEAIEYPLYRPMAELQMGMTKEVRENATSPDEAARRVADAVMADGGPLRPACDTGADRMLAQVDAASDEAWMRKMHEYFGVTSK